LLTLPENYSESPTLSKRKNGFALRNITWCSPFYDEQHPEGSGSTSKKEFVRFLDIARKSTFENANMILIFAQDDLIPGEEQKTILRELHELSRMITPFRSLRKGRNKNAGGSSLCPLLPAHMSDTIISRGTRQNTP
jgi:hypothetical protein